MKKLIQFILLVVTILSLLSCSTYKYTKYQYDEAMNAFYVGRHISEVQSKIPYPLVGLFSDGKDGQVYKYDMSISYQTPSYSTTNSNINVNSGYNGNLSIYGTQNTTTTRSRTITQKNFTSLFTDKNGNIYKVDYFMTPRMLNHTYELYKKLRGY